MATRTWQGTTGDMTSAANWGGTAPVAGDDVIINDTAIDITTGLGAVNLNSLMIGPRYTGSITVSPTTGTIGMLVCSVSGSYVRLAPSAVTTAYLRSTVQRTIYIDGGTWSTTYASGGMVIAAASAVLTTVYNDSASWVVYPNATKVTTWWDHGGNVVLDGRNVGAFHGQGNTRLTLRTSARIADGSSTGILVLPRGGRLMLEGNAVTHDSVSNHGVIDATRMLAAQTISTLVEWSGSSVVTDDAAFPLTITTRVNVTTSVTGGSGSGAPIPR